jgi:hypothetical protein
MSAFGNVVQDSLNFNFDIQTFLAQFKISKKIAVKVVLIGLLSRFGAPG